MGRRSSVLQLPRAVRAWLDQSLREGNFSGYEALEAALAERGHRISKSAIHRYGKPLQLRFDAIKTSTEAARMITEGAPDDQDARSEAAIALVQTELFETLVNLQEAANEAVDKERRVKLLSNAAKNIATLSRASVNQKRWRSEMQVRKEATEKAARAAENEAKRQGASAATIDALRAAIMKEIAR